MTRTDFRNGKMHREFKDIVTERYASSSPQSENAGKGDRRLPSSFTGVMHICFLRPNKEFSRAGFPQTFIRAEFLYDRRSLS